MSEPKPRIVDGEPVCATLSCPVRETCPYRSVALMEADRPCIPALRAERDRLAAWKREAMAVESEWDAQAIATMLGGRLGESCRNVVAEKVPQLIAENERLRGVLDRIRGRSTSLLVLVLSRYDWNGAAESLSEFAAMKLSEEIARAESAESALTAAQRESAEALFHWVNDEARRKAQGFYMADSVLGEFRAAIRGGEEG